MPKISVIIPVYNTEKYLAECLDSVLAQTFTDFEVICVNDGSPDNSAEILAEYATRDKRIKIINQPNSGVVTARNNGVTHATGEYIYPLDSDDKIVPDALEKLLAAMTAGRGDIITMRVGLFGNMHGEMQLRRPTKWNMVQDNCLVNAALMLRNDFVACGGFSSDCNIALEDYDLYLNLMFNHNKKIYRVPEILFWYRIKDADEARNQQHRDQHNKIVKNIFLTKRHIGIYRFVLRHVPVARLIVKMCDIYHDLYGGGISFQNKNISRFKKFKLLIGGLVHSWQSIQRRANAMAMPAYATTPNPRLVMTLLVKDEADIIAQNIEFHHAMGVDGFIVTDNGSTDGTRQILDEYRKKGWILEIIDEPEQNYAQTQWVNRMIRIARDKYNADWIISADADEFWRPVSGNLKNEISQTNANLLFAPIYNMRDDGDDWTDNTKMIKTFMKNKVAKKLIANDKLCKFNQFGRQIPKVIIRASEYMYIHGGNHNADMLESHQKTVSGDVYIYHYSSRGMKHFQRKVVDGGGAIERNPNLPADFGAHWRWFYRGYRDGTLDIEREYRKSVGEYCRTETDPLCISDTFIHDFFRLRDIESRFPKLLSFTEMLSMIKRGASLARYGDAEFDIGMQRNKNDPYQRPSDALSEKLMTILRRPTDKNLIVAIPPFNPKHNTVNNFRDGLNFWQWYWRERWDVLSPLFVNGVYGNSFFSRDAVFYELDVNEITSVWDNRDVVFVVPQTGRFVYDERLFGNVKSRAEINVPATSAFDEYDRIFSECKQYPKSTLFFIAAGPTATVLAADLTDIGYQALDMGHFSNCYQEYLGEAHRPENLPMDKSKKKK